MVVAAHRLTSLCAPIAFAVEALPIGGPLTSPIERLLHDAVDPVCFMPLRGVYQLLARLAITDSLVLRTFGKFTALSSSVWLELCRVYVDLRCLACQVVIAMVGCVVVLNTSRGLRT